MGSILLAQDRMEWRDKRDDGRVVYSNRKKNEEETTFWSKGAR
jgi:hypothetical protein